MAKPGTTTYEMVANIADELVKAGFTPSQRAIVDRVGGSNSTVGPFLRQWKTAHEAAKAAAGAEATARHVEVDLAVANVLRRALADLRGELQGEVAEQIVEIQQLTEERDADRVRATALAESAATLQREVDQLGGQASELRRELDSLRADRATVAAALEELRAAHSDAVAAKKALEEKGQEMQAVIGRQAETHLADVKRVQEAASAQAVAEQNLARIQVELEAKLAAERQGRSVAEQRVVSLLAAADGHAAQLQRLAASEAGVGLLKQQVESLTSLLQQSRSPGA